MCDFCLTARKEKATGQSGETKDPRASVPVGRGLEAGAILASTGSTVRELSGTVEVGGAPTLSPSERKYPTIRRMARYPGNWHLVRGPGERLKGSDRA